MREWNHDQIGPIVDDFKKTKQEQNLDGQESPESKLIENISDRFFELEQLGSTILDIHSDGSITVGNITIESPDQTLLENLRILQNKASSILSRYSKVIIGLSFASLLAIHTSTDYKKIGSFKNAKRARMELQHNGITEEQQYSGYRRGISELLFRGIRPELAEYKTVEKLASFVPNIIANAGGPGRDQMEDHDQNLPFQERQRQSTLARHDSDAWRLYLGLPQIYGTFDISQYQPAIETEGKYYYRIVDFLKNYQAAHPEENPIKSLIEFIQSKKTKGEKAIRLDTENSIMGNHTLDIGEDEKGHYLCYYDSWDLLGTSASNNPVMNGIGEVYEIYDRIHHDPITFEVIN